MKTNNPPLPSALLEELRALTQRVRACALAGEEHNALALVRLAPGLGMEEWRSLAACGDCEGWFALDLAGLPGLQDLHHAAGQNPRDPATRALNREAFVPAFQAEMGRALRRRGNVSLVLVELAHLAALPAPEGDEALLALATALLAQAQPQDLFGRLGTVLVLAMPEAGRFTALALAEGLVRSLLAKPALARAGLRAAVLERPAKEEALAACEDMLRRGLEALAEASTDSPDHRARIKCPGAEREERQTLVQASEKHFLFFGG